MDKPQLIKELHEVLGIIGYSTEDQYRRVTDFLNIAKLTFLEQILLDLPLDKRNALSSEKSKDIEQIIIKLGELSDKSPEYYENLYEEVLTGLFKDYLSTVYPHCTPAQKERIDLVTG